MAIKGKGKTKPRQVARAPRHDPVPVKPPFFRRGWVRATAAFLAGVLVLATAWWAWENLDQQQQEKDAAANLALQKLAIGAWGSGNLEDTLSTVGQLQGGGTPKVATDVGTALDNVDKGKDPGVASKDLRALSDKLRKAATTLDKFDVAGTIANHGFDASQTDVITTVQSETAAALRSLAVAASLTAEIVDDPAATKALADDARSAYQDGQALLQRAWNSYTNISAAAGVPLQPPQPLPTGG
jgi:hypothetical protein